MVRWFGME